VQANLRRPEFQPPVTASRLTPPPTGLRRGSRQQHAVVAQRVRGHSDRLR
jgi:hypothetical protein